LRRLNSVTSVAEISVKSPLTHPNADAFPRGMPGPALRALARAKLRSMGDLTRTTPGELRALHGMGPKAIRMLADALALQARQFRCD
jgi:hypothetical protein